MTNKGVSVWGVIMAFSFVALLVIRVTFAQEPAPSQTAISQVPTGLRGQGGSDTGEWFRFAPSSKPWRSAEREWGDTLGGVDEVDKLLNMTPDRIWAERVLGKTLADLATETGVSTQQLVDILVASHKTLLDQAVTDGRLTQAQADQWLDWYKQVVPLLLAEPYGFGLGGLRGRGHW